MEYNNILIVDDSSTSRMIVKRCFIIAGYNKANYLEAADALTALDMIRQLEIDLIITDLKMPKMDGTTFIKKLNINSSTKSIPIIVVSSMSTDVLEEQLIKYGARIIIQKPLSPEKVFSVMGRINEQ